MAGNVGLDWIRLVYIVEETLRTDGDISCGEVAITEIKLDMVGYRDCKTCTDLPCQCGLIITVNARIVKRNIISTQLIKRNLCGTDTSGCIELNLAAEIEIVVTVGQNRDDRNIAFYRAFPALVKNM